ncbi:MAG: FkbM family methyltransferase [Patescibacteria group bacterium]
MKCLYIHNRRSWGPKESSWLTFHYISEELERRGHLLAKYSVDFNLTDDNNNHITDTIWQQTDCLFTVFGEAHGPLKIAEARDIPSFLEINYACGEIVNPFMEKEASRLKINKDELVYEYPGAGKNTYDRTTYVVGAGNINYTEKTYREFGSNRVKMFTAGVDHEHFKPDFSARGKGKIRFTVTAASLAFRKGIIHICRAWRALPREYHHKIELHCFGKEPFGTDSAKEFRDLLKDFSNVIHHGFHSNQSVEYVREHAISDVMLCPTLAEGQSATALEGMSFGLYSIVSPYTGSDFEKIPSTILSHEPEKWVEEISSAICTIVDNYDEIKKTFPIIREHAQTNYRWDKFAKDFVDFMEIVWQDYYQGKHWREIRGDTTLRINYPIDKNSIVIDCGGFHGEWTEKLKEKYDPYIYLFEPVPQFVETLKAQFAKDAKVHIIEAAVGNKDGEEILFMSPVKSAWNSTTSTPSPGWNEVRVQVINFASWIKQQNIKEIDLLKLNIEGAEYDVLEHLLSVGLIDKICHIQIQFHRFPMGAEQRRDTIRRALSRTHKNTYNYDFVWESWSRK